MTDSEVLARIDQLRGQFGATCRKLSGAVAAEIIRRALAQQGFAVSRRDVYIRGVPVEIDLLVLKPSAQGALDLIFSPDDVLAAIEVKASGVFDGDAAEQIGRTFQKITKSNSKIRCFYVTLAERLSYKHRVTTERLGHPAYTLFGHASKNGQEVCTSTGEWYKMMWEMRSLV